MTTNYPWQRMSEGDSFLAEGDSPQLRQTLRTAGYKWLSDHSETHGHLKIFIRKEGGVAYRVWLVGKDWHPSYPLCREGEVDVELTV